MNSENESKRILVSAEPVPEELYSLAIELNSLSAADGKIYRESLPQVLLPPKVTNIDGTEQYLSDFLPKYGFPSPFHPVCCSVKSVV